MIPITKPLIDEREADAARRVILSGWITQGPEVAAFEREFAAAVSAPYACAVSNCTTGLHLALRAAGVGQGDEVITVSHSFIATASAIRYCGAIPVFVDICENTFNIDVDRVEAAISPSTRAILCVHQMGMPCDLPRLLEIAHRHSLPLIEDAACAMGSEILSNGEWERIGKPHGDVACFSFHPRKIISTGDGGMITTRHEHWNAQFRLWRQHSMSVPDTVRHSSSQVVFESYPELGFNYRMTDIQAAVGRQQLQRVSDIVAKRRTRAERYRTAFQDVPGLVVPMEPEGVKSNWQSFCLRLDPVYEQRETMQRLLDLGIATRRGIMCSHRELAYSAREPWRSAGPLHVSERAQEQGLILPLYPQMTEQEQETVISALRDVLALQRTAQAGTLVFA
jgi:perosamine synthetase